MELKKVVKIQDSIDELWRFTGEMFESDNVENNLIPENIISASNTYHDEWLKIVKETLKMHYLQTGECCNAFWWKKGLHTEKLGFMLAEMQYLPEHIPTQNGN